MTAVDLRAPVIRTSKKDSASYRPEVEGVRAVASLLVAVFHIWLGRVSGGVDVFFVIAGFLTTTTLLGHVRRYGRIRPVSFMARLASRLFPAAAVVIAAVSLLSLVLLLPYQWSQTFTEAVASATYVENWQLYRAGVDYLTQDQFHSPLQNFWAMSVQGQFYLIWAVLFGGLAVVGRLAASRRFTAHLIGSLAALSILSFGYALYAVGQDQSSAYYNTAARAWEFGLGGLAAVILPHVVIRRSIRLVAGWVGLLGIVSCGFVLQVSTEFPGVAALWPTLSVVLILVAGTGGRSAQGAETLLASRGLVWLGGLSYGLYLWHWPILVFYREYTQAPPGLAAGVAIIAAAIVLAWLSKTFVEDPLHRRVPAGGPTRWQLVKPFALLVAAALVAGVALGGVTVAAARDTAAAHRRAVAGENCFGAAALASWSACSATAAWSAAVPRVDSANDGYPVDGDQCMTNTTGTELKECVFGVRGATTRVVLIGNSHAVSLFKAYEQVAINRGWELHVFYKTGCVWNAASRRDDSELARSSCHTWVDKLQARLAEQPAYTYALTGYSAKKSVYVDESGRPDERAGIDGFRKAWAPLASRGTRILALRDNPVIPDIRRLSCQQRPGTVQTCAVSAAEGLAARDLIVEAATDWPGAAVIDLQKYYCLDGLCPLVVGGVKVYRDLGHLTATYSLTLAPYLDAEIARAG